MKYSPFKYCYRRTLWYMRQPLTWVLDGLISSIVFAVFKYEAVLTTGEILILTGTFYLTWMTFRLLMRFLCSVFVCMVARYHFGFNKEYHDRVCSR